MIIMIVTLLFLMTLAVAVSQDVSQPSLGSQDGPGFYPTYELIEEVQGLHNFSGFLHLKHPGDNPLGDNFQKLSFQAFFETDQILHIRITDANSKRWDPDDYPIRQDSLNQRYILELVRSPFSFKILRKDSTISIFNTKGKDDAPSLYFADLYMELSTNLPENPNIYGLGERVSTFRLATDDTRYTIWALAQDSIYDTGKEFRGRNMYGHHPFYLEMRDGLAHGVYMHNINAMDVQFQNGRLIYKVIGGMLDLYFFMGPTPQAVIQQYHSVIGAPMLPPFWALGFHQSRWGYSSLTALQDVVLGYDTNDIPMDVLWSDIDYMEEYKDFTLDETRYPYAGFADLIEKLHNTQRRYVPIVDAGIKVVPGFFAYEQGKEMDVFIRRRTSAIDDFLGVVWPGQSVFVDWFQPNSNAYWSQMLDTFSQVVPFDGIWVDMNEVSSFCDGECPGFYSSPEEQMSLPYTPGNHSLEDQVLPLKAKQYGDDLMINYNTHGTYGTMETVATYKYLAEKKKERPFILSRSSRAGHGKWGFHWLGDNWSLWSQMRESVAGVFDFQMFGIGLVGADICGFHNDTTEELCSRWHQLGGFYPFMRNHNDIGWIGQELYALGPDVMRRGKEAIRLRYSLSSYIYTRLHLFSNIADKVYGMLFRPLFYDFPTDNETYGNQEQIMVGPALLFNPVLYEGNTSVLAYIPPSAIWYDYFTGLLVPRTPWQVFPASLDSISLLIRGGFTISTQNSSSALTITEMRKKPIDFLVALDETGHSSGSLIIDDGISLETIEKVAFSTFEIHTFCQEKNCSISLTREVAGFENNQEYTEIGNLQIFGLGEKTVTDVRLGEANLTYEMEGPKLNIGVNRPLTTLETIEVQF